MSPARPWRYRLTGWLWDHSQLWRRPLRSLRLQGSLWLYRLRRPRPPRVVPRLSPSPRTPLSHPAIGLLVSSSEVPQATAWLAGQTETSVHLEIGEETSSQQGVEQQGVEQQGVDPTLPCPTLWLTYEPQLDTLPANLLESLLLSAATDGAPLSLAGWAAPAVDLAGPQALLYKTSAEAVVCRLPDTTSSPTVLGRVVPHIGGEAADQEPQRSIACLPGSQASGPYLLRGDAAPGTLVTHPIGCPKRALEALPPIPGPPTALFLLPFLAVGGAERLLFDLLAGLCPHYRCLVVTLEPHRQQLGQSVDLCRQWTPHVYTLGDWLPRQAHAGAIEHLLRRYHVDSLVCWNGIVAFYDEAFRWKQQHPQLRLLNQLYNHQGGWIEHYGPRFAKAIDVHLAVNGAIAEALVERGVPHSRVATVHHGVEVPELPNAEQKASQRRRARHLLGLDHLSPDTVVVGTFIRLHAQKRPLDILATARRLTHLPVHFLLVGGGPLDAAIDRQLTEAPLANLTRLGLRDDLDTLYAAIDLCLLTSDYEGLPIFLLDGLVRTLPCVATAVGEIPELLAEGGGVLVREPGDIDALASGIETLLDAKARHLEGHKGRQTVAQHFDLETYRRHYEKLIFPSRSEGSR